MKPAHFALMGLMALAIVLLVLNLWERDRYEHGELEPPPPGSNVLNDDPLLARLFPPEFVHSCPTCGDCRHPLEILENRRVMTLRDHDGWYRLFWAKDETYHYDDPVYLANGLQNPTAREPAGTWTIRGRVGPAAHPPPAGHDCGEVPREVSTAFDLVVSEHPVAETGGQVQEIVYRCRSPHLPPVLHLGWRLAGTMKVSPVPCPCGKP